MKEKQDLKILLLQIRDDEIVKKEEHESFAYHAGIELKQIDILNVFDTPDFSPDILMNYDALFVGGASTASVLEPESFPFVPSCIKMMNYCVEHSIPTFASCFGFQVAVLAFGGTIVKDINDFEMGTLPITLTNKAESDPIYSKTPSGFKAVSVHQEKAIELPVKCELLAYTEDCCHSFKVKNKPFWAFQFHPELNREKLTERLGVYRDKYTEDRDHYEKVIASLVETPEANKLVSRFIDYILDN